MKAFWVQIRQKLCLNCEVSWSTYLLVVLFGIGSWVAVNGIWVELPVLVQHAPESWKLPSVFAVVIQIANIGPLLHTVFNAFWPGKVRDTWIIYIILSIGIICCGLLVFLWKETGVVLGEEHSVSLIALVFFLAFVACTSSVTFLPFMAVFKKEYMSALFVGAGLSGLLPSLLAVAQDTPSSGDPCANYTQGNTTWSASDNLNFSTSIFFLNIMFLMVVSLLAFFCLNTLSSVKQERVDYHYDSDAETFPREALSLDSSQEFELHRLEENDETYLYDGSQPGSEMQKWKLAFLLIIQVWIHAFSNGVVPSIQPFACIPYGNNVYYLTLIISNVANPCSSLLFSLLSTTHLCAIAILSSFYTTIVAFIITAAKMSPNPPMVNSSAGPPIIVLANVLSVALVTYTKVAISTRLRKQGKKHLQWAGIALQSGSFLGAMVTFLFVNVFDSFSQC
ncbi:riboflavin transporter 2-like [Xenia sp. Carnegie-2017]|uniref:riboflavin transporter 2-like n=1 Tax=Xenia sp. Carnegie-2017 TaxID=2897299 RepID=UPI001F047E1D|nr:riboflavin transporter 2-like [Xenia sp. Carnegie-2017]